LIKSFRDVGRAVINGIKNPPDKALDLVRSKRIVRLVTDRNKYYIAMGVTGDYFLIPRTFCSCKDFELNVVIRRSKGTCYHLIALELAVRKGYLRELKVSEEELKAILYEIIYLRKSTTLRKKLLSIET